MLVLEGLLSTAVGWSATWFSEKWPYHAPHHFAPNKFCFGSKRVHSQAWYDPSLLISSARNDHLYVLDSFYQYVVVRRHPLILSIYLSLSLSLFLSSPLCITTSAHSQYIYQHVAVRRHPMILHFASPQHTLGINRDGSVSVQYG